jgi:hypothetical protein
MGYIKCTINSRMTDEEGIPKVVRISRLESDMADTSLFELPILMHALAVKGLVEIIHDFILDTAQLDNEQYLLG